MSQDILSVCVSVVCVYGSDYNTIIYFILFFVKGPRLQEERTVSKTASVRWAPGWILYPDCLEVSLPSCSIPTCCWIGQKQVCSLMLNLFFSLSLSHALALPPPPALDEEAPANYFNLDPSSSPAVMNISLPPPPGINPPPPGEPSEVNYFFSGCCIISCKTMTELQFYPFMVSTN